MDTGELIPTLEDAGHRFILNEIDHDLVPEERQDIMEVHRMSWTSFSERSTHVESSWYRGLVEHINGLAEGRLSLVKLWVESNLVRFADHKTTYDALPRVERHERGSEDFISTVWDAVRKLPTHMHSVQSSR
jgi:hypothetical protein